MKVKSCLTISFNILKITGAAPYLYRKSVTHRNVKIFSGAVHTLLVAVGVPTMGYFNNFLDYEIENSLLESYTVCSWAHVVTFTLSILLTLFNGRSFDKVLTRIYQLENSINTEHKDMQKVKAVLITCITVGIVILVVIFSYIVVLLDITLSMILGNLCFFISEGCNLIMIVNFVGMMYVLRLFFSTVKCEIVKYQQNIRLQLQRNNRVDDDAFAACISKVMDQHMKLCQVSEMLNSTHSLQIVLWILSSSYTMTSCICIAFEESVLPMTLGVGEFTCLGIWVVYHIARICIIVHAAHTTALQANNMGVIITRLLTQIDDPALSNQLQQYSLQLLHRKIQFTGLGMFPLDYTLLYNILGAITTYVVIMAQFRLSF